MWNTVPDAAKNLSKREKESIVAVDDGGPEAQFLSYIFQRLPVLKVSLPGKNAKSIELFQTDGIPSGYLPTTDAQFKSRFWEKVEEQDGEEEYKCVIRKAERYYRAIGRLFAYCLSVGHKLPSEALPKLLRNGEYCWHVSAGFLPSSANAGISWTS
jgi:hypothetical protein